MEVPLAADDPGHERRLTAQDPVVDVLRVGQPGLDTIQIALDRIRTKEEVGLLRNDVPHDESRPDSGRLVADGVVAGKLLVKQILTAGPHRLALVAGDSLRRLAVFTGWPRGDAVEAFEGGGFPVVA